jgi:hypothetical protein
MRTQKSERVLKEGFTFIVCVRTRKQVVMKNGVSFYVFWWEQFCKSGRNWRFWWMRRYSVIRRLESSRTIENLIVPYKLDATRHCHWWAVPGAFWCADMQSSRRWSHAGGMPGWWQGLVNSVHRRLLLCSHTHICSGPVVIDEKWTQRELTNTYFWRWKISICLFLYCLKEISVYVFIWVENYLQLLLIQSIRVWKELCVTMCARAIFSIPYL